MRVRFRLDPLRRPAAIEVMTHAAGGMFSRPDAEKLATDLGHRRVRTFGKLALVPSEFVEPMQLQLACDEKWRRGGRSGAMAKPRDPDEALIRYLDAGIARARAGWNSEAKIRRFIGDKLLTPEGERSAVIRGKRHTGGLNNKLVDRLEQERIVRAEERLGTRWYELAHDRLLEPMRLSNATWFEASAAAAAPVGSRCCCCCSSASAWPAGSARSGPSTATTASRARSPGSRSSSPTPAAPARRSSSRWPRPRAPTPSSACGPRRAASTSTSSASPTTSRPPAA
ncbi:hypothetical protein [Nannocystis pusilla]|uniref:hypothetical protein n=1 Tax=Nannocystis pusilla TaxID=889268 RepID=UPI003B7AAFAE